MGVGPELFTLVDSNEGTEKGTQCTQAGMSTARVGAQVTSRVAFSRFC